LAEYPPAPLDRPSDRGAETERDMRDLAQGALMSFVGRLGRISRGAFLWIVPVLYGLDVLGQYTITWGVIAVLSCLGRFGMQRGVLRFVVEGRAAGDERRVEAVLAAGLSLCLVMSLLTTAGIYLAADWIAAAYDLPSTSALRIMAWTCPLMNLGWALLAATRALRIMRYEVYAMSIWGPLVLLLGALVASPFHLGLDGVAWAQLAMAIACFALGLYYFTRHFSLLRCFRRLPSRSVWRELIRFSIPVTATDLLSSTLTQLDALMLGWFVADERVALFRLARLIASVLLKAPQAFDPIFSPVVSELAFQRRFTELKHRFVAISRWVLIINLPIGAGILIVADQLLGWQAGKELASLGSAEMTVGLQVLLLLCAGTMVQSAFALAEPLLIMTGKPVLNLLNNGLWLATNFLLNLWLIDRLGLLGAAIGAVVAILLVNGLRLLQVYLIHRIHPFDRTLAKPALAAAIAAVVGWCIHHGLAGGLAAMFGALAAFLAIYVLLLAVLGPEPDDRRLLTRFWSRARRLGRE
jgi:O-antigen/teichoic acid export membrane protein